MPSHRHTPPREWRTVAAAGCLVAALAGCGGSSVQPRPVSRAPMISLFEAPALLAAAPGQTLDELRRLGVGYVRVTVPWVAVAPRPQAARPPVGFAASSPDGYPASAWRTLDAIVTGATARGIRVDLDPTAPAPRWASASGEPAGGPPGVWKPDATAFGRFVHALGIRYNGRFRPSGGSAPLPRVSFWSVWNEPNLGVELAPQAIENSRVEYAPVLYRRLVDAYWNALQQTGHGSDTILIGELAPGGTTAPGFPGNFAGTVPLRFVRALYCVDASFHPLTGPAAAARSCPTTSDGVERFPAEHPALFHASAYAVHPYSQGELAPTIVTPGEPDYANLAALPHLEHTLDAIQSVYGSVVRFPLYSTEYGYKTNPPYVAGVPVALAPSFLNWAEYLSWLDPRIRSFDQYLLTDPPASTGSKFDSGLEFADGSPKPTLAAFRLPLYLPRTSAPRGTQLEVWGCVRPARYAPQAPPAVLEFRGRDAGRFRPLRTLAGKVVDCYFDVRIRFPGSGSVRLSWTYPRGMPIHSRVITVRLF